MSSFVLDESGDFIRLDDGSLVITAPGAALTACTLTFQDFLGNPLPPRVLVTIFNAGDPPTAIPMGSAYLGLSSNAVVNLQVGNVYRVQYSGDKSPSLASTFIAAANVSITPDFYASPWANQNGYTNEQASLIPTGRVASTELQPGGGLYVMLQTFASVMAQLDVFHRLTDASLRFDSSELAENDTWAADFLGGTLPALSGESDEAYNERVDNWLQQPFTTITSVAEAVLQYFTANPDGSTYQTVFSWQTDPQRAAYYGLQSGQIAILENFVFPSTGLNWWIGQSFVGQNTFLTSSWTSSFSSYPGLVSIVDRVKALGIVPVFITAVNEPSALS